MEKLEYLNEGPTIKERLLPRFLVAKERVGKNWRQHLTNTYPFYDTSVSLKYMTSTAQAVTDGTRGNVDRIERVTIYLEKIAGIKPIRIV